MSQTCRRAATTPQGWRSTLASKTNRSKLCCAARSGRQSRACRYQGADCVGGCGRAARTSMWQSNHPPHSYLPPGWELGQLFWRAKPIHLYLLAPNLPPSSPPRATRVDKLWTLQRWPTRQTVVLIGHGYSLLLPSGGQKFTNPRRHCSSPSTHPVECFVQLLATPPNPEFLLNLIILVMTTEFAGDPSRHNAYLTSIATAAGICTTDPVILQIEREALLADIELALETSKPGGPR
ncbi:hypothetical protein BC629DRAFT_867187 [Irpex lacteus]|nr:hypothetical protein BC629DRAFT_867187 [Irpex lacteus]